MQLEIVYREAHELVTSFFSYTCKSTPRRAEQEKKWRAEIERSLPDSYRQELERDELLSKVYKSGSAHILVEASPASDARGFIGWLGERSSGEMYEMLSPHMKQFPEELGIVRDKLVHHLNTWNEVYFRHIDPAIHIRLKKEAEARNRQLSKVKDVEAFVEEVTNGLVFEREPHVEKLVLTPQFHSRPLNCIYAFETLSWWHYAFDALSEENEEEPSALLREAAKGLSDVNRLKILRFLRNGPRSYSEVLKHIGLAKSTVYEHMLILRSAGLIRTYVVGDSASSYSLRREGIEKLNRELEQWLQ